MFAIAGKQPVQRTGGSIHRALQSHHCASGRFHQRAFQQPGVCRQAIADRLEKRTTADIDKSTVFDGIHACCKRYKRLVTPCQLQWDTIVAGADVAKRVITVNNRRQRCPGNAEQRQQLVTPLPLLHVHQQGA